MAAVTDPTDASAPLPLGTQLVRFIATGVVSAAVDFGILVGLQYLADWDHNAAKAVSFVFGTLTAYSINRIWTFRADHSARRLAAVALLYLVTFVLQVGTFAALFPWLLGAAGRDLANVVGFVVAQGLATMVNFIVQRTLIFRSA